MTYAVFYKGASQPIDYTPSAAVTAGDVVVLGSNILMAKRDIAANTQGELHVGAVWDMPKEAAVAHNQGDLVYWDATNHVITKTASTHKKFGIVAADAAEADARGKYLSIPQAA